MMTVGKIYMEMSRQYKIEQNDRIIVWGCSIITIQIVSEGHSGQSEG